MSIKRGQTEYWWSHNTCTVLNSILLPILPTPPTPTFPLLFPILPAELRILLIDRVKQILRQDAAQFVDIVDVPVARQDAINFTHVFRIDFQQLLAQELGSMQWAFCHHWRRLFTAGGYRREAGASGGGSRRTSDETVYADVSRWSI